MEIKMNYKKADKILSDLFKFAEKICPKCNENNVIIPGDNICEHCQDCPECGNYACHKCGEDLAPEEINNSLKPTCNNCLNIVEE
jgi:hypothetical protein